MNVLPIDKQRVFGIETEYGLDPAPLSASDQIRTEHLNAVLPDYMHPSGKDGFNTYGGRIYADQFKNVEVATPELTTVEGLLASHFAGESHAYVTVRRLTRDPDTGEPYRKAVKRSLDSRKNSRGEHDNFLVGLDFNDDDMSKLLPHLASRIILTGCGGIVNDENKRWQFTLDMRAMVTKELISTGSTRERSKPFMKTLAKDYGNEYVNEYNRLQVVSSSQNMFAYPIAARIFNTSSIIRLAEHGLYPRHLAYRDPLQALHTYAQDPSLTAKAELYGGRLYTAAEMQAELLDAVLKHDDIPKQELDIALLSRQILTDLMEGRREQWTEHLEWAAKYTYYRRQAERAEQPFPNVRNAQTDIQWHELSGRSLAVRLRKAGRVAMMPGLHDMAEAKRFPPDPTRASARATMLAEIAYSDRELFCLDWGGWRTDTAKASSFVYIDPWQTELSPSGPRETKVEAA